MKSTGISIVALLLISCPVIYSLIIRSVGDYVFTIEETLKNPTISVSSVAKKHLVWKTYDNLPFVKLASAVVTLTPVLNGNFQVDESIQTASGAISIDDVSPVSDFRLEIEGTLFESIGSGTVGTYSLQFDAVEASLLKFSVQIFPTSISPNPRLFLTYWCNSDESFYGFGESFTYFNMKGRVVPVLVSEQGVGRGEQPITDYLNENVAPGVGGYWYTTYAPKPYYVTNYNRSLLLNNTEITYFNLSQPDAVEVEVWSLTMEGWMSAENTMLDAISNITRITGRQSVLPEWSQKGAVVGLEGGTTNVTRIVTELLRGGVPVAGVWLQDWVGMRHSWDGDRLIWNWELNKDYYPGWNVMVNTWAERDIRVLTYISPFFSDPTGFVDSSEMRHNFYQEGIENGYFVKNSTGSTYFLYSLSIQFAMVDVTNPFAVRWLKDIIINQLIDEAGSSGWMCDFGEYLPFDAVMHNGQPASAVHNQYPELWAQVAYEAIQEASLRGMRSLDGTALSGSDIVYFMRSAWIRSPASVPVFWLGDQLTSWDGNDGLRSAVVGALSSGLSGHTITHSDIGGYNVEMLDEDSMYYVRTPELLKRWSEMSAFGFGLFRTHIGSSTSPLNAQIYDSADSIAHFAKFASIYANMSAYRMQLMEQARDLGYPLIRPLMLHYANDSHAWEIVDEYLVGTEFLVAPCMTEHAANTSVYFPKFSGPWVHLWSGNTVHVRHGRGLTLTVPSGIGFPAVFYEGDSLAGAALREFVVASNYTYGYEWVYDDSEPEEDEVPWWKSRGFLYLICIVVGGVLVLVLMYVAYRRHHKVRSSHNPTAPPYAPIPHDFAAVPEPVDGILVLEGEPVEHHAGDLYAPLMATAVTH